MLTGHGGMENLEFHTNWPTPIPGAGEVLIRVHACGLNNTDVNTRIGWYSKAVTESTSDTSFATEHEADLSWGGSPLAFPRIQGADAAVPWCSWRCPGAWRNCTWHRPSSTKNTSATSWSPLFELLVLIADGP